ncbi:unnamed protein product, partial [Dibothriocephalus latus]
MASYLCKTCFLASIHTEHKYQKEQISCGFCACGHEEAWTSGVYCRIHGGDELQEEKNLPKSGGSGDGAQVLPTVEEEQRQEMERLQQRLEALPLDVDAAQLAAFTTASSNKRISEVEARCRAQQSRANRLHPLLYATRSREDSEARFSAILYISEVQHLRPIICNALLGRYVAFSTTATAEGGVSAFESAFLLPGEMLAEQSLLAQYFAQVHAAHGGLRRSLAAVITAFLMQETFYQSVFAIEFIR